MNDFLNQSDDTIKSKITKELLQEKDKSGNSFFYNFINKICPNKIEILKYVFDFTKKNCPELLLEKDSYSQNILFWGIMNHLEILKYIFEEIEVLNPHLILEKDIHNDTILHSLMRFHEIEVFKYMFSKKISTILDKNEDKDTILHILMENNNLEIIKFVFSELIKIAPPTFFMEKNNYGYNILHLAVVFHHDIEIIKYIFSAVKPFSNKMFQEKDKDCNTILHELTQNYNLKIVKYVLKLFMKHFPDLILEKNVYGNTILHDVCYNEEIKIVKYWFSKFKQSKIFLEKNNNGETCSDLLIKEHF